jgi:hypothetical protein
MIAPPKPPSQDELEALIKEARARQLRRRLLGAAGIAIAAAVGLSVYALTADTARRPGTATKARPRAALPCAAAGGWRLRANGLWSEPTGQHTAPFRVIRVGARPCTLRGYPSIVLLDARGRRLDFRYSHRGDLVISAHPPRPVHVSGNGAAYFMLNKYRCDIRSVALARWLRVGLPGVRGRLVLRLPPSPLLDFCPRELPSTTIAVSPIVARPIQAVAQPNS